MAIQMLILMPVVVLTEEILDTMEEVMTDIVVHTMEDMVWMETVMADTANVEVEILTDTVRITKEIRWFRD